MVEVQLNPTMNKRKIKKFYVENCILIQPAHYPIEDNDPHIYYYVQQQTTQTMAICPSSFFFRFSLSVIEFPKVGRNRMEKRNLAPTHSRFALQWSQKVLQIEMVTTTIELKASKLEIIRFEQFLPSIFNITKIDLKFSIT